MRATDEKERKKLAMMTITFGRLRSGQKCQSEILIKNSCRYDNDRSTRNRGFDDETRAFAEDQNDDDDRDRLMTRKRSQKILIAII